MSEKSNSGAAFAYVTTLFFAWGFVTSVIDPFTALGWQAALIPFAMDPVYDLTKHAVVALSEALFNELYDTEHVPLLLKLPGCVNVVRYKTEAAGLPPFGLPRTRSGAASCRRLPPARWRRKASASAPACSIRSTAIPR
jgi:hypothetical protein